MQCFSSFSLVKSKSGVYKYEFKRLVIANVCGLRLLACLFVCLFIYLLLVCLSQFIFADFKINMNQHTTKKRTHHQD